MKKILSRPLTPHLTVYSGQYTSIYSIWHRITGISLIFAIVLYLTFLKFSSYGIFSFINTYLYIDLWVNNTIFLNILLFFLYHVFNGIRHIIWDLGFMLPIIKIIKSIWLINFLILSYSLITVIKIAY